MTNSTKQRAAALNSSEELRKHGRPVEYKQAGTLDPWTVPSSRLVHVGAGRVDVVDEVLRERTAFEGPHAEEFAGSYLKAIKALAAAHR